jgi:hypothetical protein
LTTKIAQAVIIKLQYVLTVEDNLAGDLFLLRASYASGLYQVLLPQPFSQPGQRISPW